LGFGKLGIGSLGCYLLRQGWNLHSNSAFSRVKFQIVVLGASFEKSKNTKIIVVSITLYIMKAPQMAL